MTDRSIPKVKAVVNYHTGASYDVKIMRPSKWGNPFRVGHDGDRDKVIAKYRAYVLSQPQLMAALPELDGKILGCCCKPLACHGDVLAELVQALPEAFGAAGKGE